MNTRFKFRAWDEDQYMFVPSMITFDDTDAVAWQGKTYKETVFGQHGSAVMIMQSTGLVDCEGVDIFEGDILNISGTIVPVEWKDGGFGYILPHSFIPFCGHAHLKEILSRSRVVGNVYQNKDLLKSEE